MERSKGIDVAEAMEGGVIVADWVSEKLVLDGLFRTVASVCCTADAMEGRLGS